MAKVCCRHVLSRGVLGSVAVQCGGREWALPGGSAAPQALLSTAGEPGTRVLVLPALPAPPMQ